MTVRRNLIFLLIISQSFTGIAQVQDTLRYKKLIHRSILPAVLIGAGAVVNNSQFEMNLQTNLRDKVGDNFNYHIDDYLQYVPVVELYLADMLGAKSKNYWFDQTKYLLLSNLFSSSITHGLKRITEKTRPNGSPYSFPSGHTTFAFTNATVLFNEFNQTSPVLAYSGYAFATTTGVYRMLNNKHWFSDVLVGAGIGLLVTELVYYFEPFKAFNPFKKSNSVSFIPKISEHGYGFYFSYKL